MLAAPADFEVAQNRRALAAPANGDELLARPLVVRDVLDSNRHTGNSYSTRSNIVDIRTFGARVCGAL